MRCSLFPQSGLILLWKESHEKKIVFMFVFIDSVHFDLWIRFSNERDLSEKILHARGNPHGGNFPEGALSARAFSGKNYTNTFTYF